MSTVYALSLNSSLDRTFYVRSILFEDINRVDEVCLHPGGKGANVARMVHRLGGQASVLTFLGGATGRTWRTLMRKEGVPVLPVRTAGDIRTIFNFIETSTGKVLRINERGPRISLEETRRFFQKLSSFRATSRDIIVLSGSLPPPLDASVCARILRIARKRTPLVALDADGENLRRGIAVHPYFIKPNLFELERAVGKRIRCWGTLQGVCRDLVDNGIGVVLLTLGERGALCFSRAGIWAARPPRVRVLSNIGCGDASLAGFLKGFSTERSPEELLRQAVACGAAKAACKGTEMPSLRDINALLKKVRSVAPESLFRSP